jgi:hypothetical protein
LANWNEAVHTGRLPQLAALDCASARNRQLRHYASFDVLAIDDSLVDRFTWPASARGVNVEARPNVHNLRSSLT